MGNGTEKKDIKSLLHKIGSGAKKGTAATGSKVEGALSKIPLLKKVTILPKGKKRAAYTALALVVLIPSAYMASGMAAAKDAGAQVTEYTVKKGNVEVSISGSGTVTPIEQYDIVALVEGDVIQDTFAEGDTVSEGAILYIVDSEEKERQRICLPNCPEASSREFP